MLPEQRNEGGTLEVRMMTDYANIARPRRVCPADGQVLAGPMRVDLIHDGLRRRHAAMHCMQAIHILDGENIRKKRRKYELTGMSSQRL